MFVSENACFEEGRAIKGGIPICWPWFGAAPENSDHPNHGFARNSFWAVSSIEMLKNGSTKIKLELPNSDNFKILWPHSFYLSLEIIIGDTLTLELLTRNTGNEPFTITEALHTYFNVGDSSQVQLLGLERAEYLNKIEKNAEACQISTIALSKETDRIYVDEKHELTLIDPVFKRKINIHSSGNNNVIVWNPWVHRSAEISDLKSEDYKQFICIEIANAATNKVIIQPETEYKLMTNYAIENIL